MMQKNNNWKLFAVVSPKKSIYTQSRQNQIKSNLLKSNQNYLRNYKYKNQQNQFKINFQKRTITQGNKHITDNLTDNYQKNQKTNNNKSTFESLRKVQNNKSNQITKYKNLHNSKSQTFKCCDNNASPQLPITIKSKILSQKYKFSLYTSNQKSNTKKMSLKLKQSQKNRKLQLRSYTKSAYLKGLNSQKIRSYQNWKIEKNQRTNSNLIQKQQNEQLQQQNKQIQDLIFAQNIKIQCNSKQQSFSKFFICSNCLDIFLIIQANNHNQVCQLIYANHQLQDRLNRIATLLKSLYVDYYQERFKYKCYLDTSQLIKTILSISNQKNRIFKNLKGIYKIQQLDAIMETIQQNMLKQELQKQKNIFKNINSIILKDKYSLKSLINQNDLFWLIGRLLQKTAYQKLNQFWYRSNFQIKPFLE